ncbi:hypothetical protein N7481_007041 [Penicillium waksmanii]|uniref:uncharacterized protein n=1 Tax=Penicillium waksmanii TaxID=69791 RepID=UPI002549A74E|nr:uncharacterized protein N7481_007041 [Penicillium waksmanii]KAJ5979743.1 hypothetical protein N7481_007041 [Penicillium waksmanii]
MAVTLTYLIYSVCKNHEVKAKPVEELSTLHESFTDKDLRNLSYLDNIITETLRTLLCPADYLEMCHQRVYTSMVISFLGV